MLKKTLVALAACAVVATSTVATAPAASAASTPGCVTKAEYKKAKKKMTVKQVSKLFGTNGRREARASSGGYVSEIRTYKTCSRYSAVAISFDKKPGGTLRLSAKSAVWVD
jgi:hypothetical protein